MKNAPLKEWYVNPDWTWNELEHEARDEIARLRTALSEIAALDEDPPEGETQRLRQAGLGGHPCGCYYDSGIYRVSCDVHDVERSPIVARAALSGGAAE